MIVTHQKRTMEIASMMYGVSLNKDGTTKVLCQRLEPVEPPVEEVPPGTDDDDVGVVEVPETERVG
jgi:hypothetical protein